MIPTGVLAKHVIGQAVTLAQTEDSESLQNHYLYMFYNLAINDVYNLLVVADRQSLLYKLSADVTDGDKSRHKLLNLNVQTNDFTNFDIIYDLEIISGGTAYETKEIPAAVFNTAKIISAGPVYPYTTSVLYSIFGSIINVLFGQGISATKIASASYTVHFIKKPSMLVDNNNDTLYAEVPSNYISLLALRIAAYIEYRNGITEKSLAVFNNTMESMISNLKVREQLTGANVKKELDFNLRKSLEE
jgi:hypothetical protein